MVRLNTQTVALLCGALTTIVGGAEMRMAVARMEDKLTAIDRRLTRVEMELDRSGLTASYQTPASPAPR